jgi:uncharacterized membrane protein
MNQFVNNSIYSSDKLFTADRWLFRIKVNDYQVVTIFWNIFLAMLPFVLGYILIRYWQKTGLRRWPQKLLGLALWCAWLLFLPNTAYVISDVRHLLDYCPRDTQFRVCQENAWMPVFFFTYALFGWLSFVYGLTQMKAFIAAATNRIVSQLYILLVIPLIALGLLLGLVNRFNSWDAFMHPQVLSTTILAYYQNSLNFTNLVILSILLYILYGLGHLALRPIFWLKND